MKRKWIFFLFVVLTVLWVAFIFSNSLESGAESGQKSGQVMESVNGILTALGLPPASHAFIRKAAHVTEFCMLGMLLCTDVALFGASRLIRPRRLWAFGGGALLGVVVAVTDETLQCFSVSRGPSVTDVLIDTVGVILGFGIFFGAYAIYDAIKRKREKDSKKENSEVTV